MPAKEIFPNKSDSELLNQVNGRVQCTIGLSGNNSLAGELNRLQQQKRLQREQELLESTILFAQEKRNRECTDRATILKELKDELKGLRERLVHSLFLFIIYCDCYVEYHVVYREILCCLVCLSTMKHSKSLQLLVLRRSRCKSKKSRKNLRRQQH